MPWIITLATTFFFATLEITSQAEGSANKNNYQTIFSLSNIKKKRKTPQKWC